MKNDNIKLKEFIADSVKIYYDYKNIITLIIYLKI